MQTAGRHVVLLRVAGKLLWQVQVEGEGDYADQPEYLGM